MKLIQQRQHCLAKSSYSTLTLDGQQLCFIIEDIHREVKVANETRIPTGTYEIKFREVLSPMTKRYREKFPEWFTWHLEYQDVPDFEHVYVHIGNSAKDSSGCTLVNNGVVNKGDEYVGVDSTSVYEVMYKLISEVLNNGERVFITVRDEEYLINPF